MHRILRKFIPIFFVVLVIAAAGWWYLGREQAAVENDSLLTASGTIEATQVILAPEIGGQVIEVLAQEGDKVRAGQQLISFADQILLAQWSQAEAAMKLASANYDLVAAGPTTEARQVGIASAELELINAQQALDALYDNADLARAYAQQAIANADLAVEKTRRRVDYLQGTADNTDIDIAKANVALAEKNLERAEDAYEPYANKPESNLRRAQLLSQKAAAQQQYDAAVRKLNALEGTGDEIDIAVAEGDLLVAQAMLEDANRQYEQVKDGPDPDALTLAEAQLALAQAHLAAAKAEPSPEQLAVAQAQVDSAESALDIIAAQLDKLVLHAPMGGIVLSRSVEPGEVVLPGASLMTIAHLEDLTITVYIPEDRYGAIHLGQEAVVTADSFPGEKFTGTVVYIADEAEFTPRNVQTAEGRRTTVFAVRLAVEDPTGDLKPGMPADVVFKE